MITFASGAAKICLQSRSTLGYAVHAVRRASQGQISRLRRALAGKTFKRSATEARGRKRILSGKNVKALERTRLRLIAKANGEEEVHWDDIVRAARVPRVDRTTASKNLRAAGYDVKWRSPRLKPSRGEADESERKRICNIWRKLPASRWTKGVDMILDSKKWRIPARTRGKQHLKQLRVRGHLRSPARG